MTKRSVLVALAVVALLVVTSSTLAIRLKDVDASGSSTSFDPYIHRPTGELADPINLIFHGDPAAVQLAIQQVVGWDYTDGGAMTFLDDGVQRATVAQFGQDLGHGSRYHLRVEDIAAKSGSPTILAAVHRDDTVVCGHVGRAFNLARDLVADRFAQAGYTVTHTELKNTEPGRQCDGSFTFGDGGAAIIDVP